MEKVINLLRSEREQANRSIKFFEKEIKIGKDSGNCDVCNGKEPCNSCSDFYFPLRPRPFETADHSV